jgi:enoyl-[acyl-carrier-protein] reductase (NADH)
MVMTGPAQALSEGGDWQKRMLDKQTIKRPVTLEELAHVVSFLTSPLSGCVTGQVIHLGLVT